MSVPEVSILGGGWSVRGIDLKKLPGFIIAVNDAAMYAPFDAVVTMDRLWTENRWEFLKSKAKPAYIRTAALLNIKERPEWLRPFGNINAAVPLSEVKSMLSGNNSGFCACNLAYILRPKLIRLYGFDMNRGPDGYPYFYPPYPWAKPTGGTGTGRYAQWAKGFDVVRKACDLAGIRVLNMSQTSAITAFEKARAAAA